MNRNKKLFPCKLTQKCLICNWLKWCQSKSPLNERGFTVCYCYDRLLCMCINTLVIINPLPVKDLIQTANLNDIYSLVIERCTISVLCFASLKLHWKPCSLNHAVVLTFCSFKVPLWFIRYVWKLLIDCFICVHRQEKFISSRADCVWGRSTHEKGS